MNLPIPGVVVSGAWETEHLVGVERNLRTRLLVEDDELDKAEPTPTKSWLENGEWGGNGVVLALELGIMTEKEELWKLIAMFFYVWFSLSGVAKRPEREEGIWVENEGWGWYLELELWTSLGKKQNWH